MSWRVQRVRSSAGDFHARDVPDPAERAAWVCDATGPALVLGSAQREDDVDREACAAAGIEVVRRRSGGGAVLMVPGEVLWVDLVLPVGDVLWQDDVGLAFHWVGETWAAALGDLGVSAVVHRGPLVRATWSAEVCFAGLGPGEVTVGGRKVVGISQRRTRAAARFQCAALARWDAVGIVSRLGLPPQAAGDVRDVATGIGLELESLLAALLRRLP
jgi:lipoate---protein ligase